MSGTESSRTNYGGWTTVRTVKNNWEVNAKFRDGTTEPIGTFDSGPFSEDVMVASWRNFIVSRAPECVVNAPGLAHAPGHVMAWA